MKKIKKTFKTDLGQAGFIRDTLIDELEISESVKFDVFFQKKDGSNRLRFAELDIDQLNGSRDFMQLLVRDKILSNTDNNIRTITLDKVIHLHVYSQKHNEVISIDFNI
jgi:hypothetical protein